MKVPNKPLNAYFWLAVAALALAGGLAYGQMSGINDEMDAYSGALGTAAAYDSARIEVRNLNMELQEVDLGSDDADFTEVDEVLESF